MKPVVTKKSLRLILRWIQHVLVAGAISMLAYCGFVLTDAWIFQKSQRGQFDRLLSYRQRGNNAAGQAVPPTSSKDSPPAVSGGLIGRIEILRLGLSAIVIEGTSTMTLRRAAGHISGTALPGQPGNVCISGHRDTFFRPLRDIRRNDVITLTTLFGDYRYRVVSTKVVGKSDVAVLDPSRNEILTLITCYPFYFVGAAPDRFIVRAERIT
jgi:sortase A